MYAEASYPQKANDVAQLLSTMQKPAPSGKCLEFWYHMYGKAMGSLIVQIKDSVQSAEIWKKSGNQGNLWQKGRATLKSTNSFQVELKKSLNCIYLVKY